MNPIARVLGGPVERKAIDLSPLTWTSLLGGVSSKSGQAVSVNTGLRVMAALACGRVLAEGVAMLPLKVYRDVDAGGKERARNHPLYRKLWARPNKWMTSFEFRETGMYHAVFSRGAFAYKNMVGGQLYELIPLLPGNVTVVRRPVDGTIEYEIRDATSSLRTVSRDQILHVRGPSWDSVAGLDIVDLARESLGLSLAIEDSQARLYGNGAKPGGIISTDKPLDRKDIERIKGAWHDAYAGGNLFKTAILDNGMKFQSMALTGVDAQTLESRKFQIEEVCRAFRVYPSMIFHSDKASTYASAELFSLDNVKYSFSPWLVRWEQAMLRDLFTDAEVDEGYTAEFSVEGLLRGDSAARAEFYASAIVNGWMTRNEARQRENLNPLTGLDKPLRPLNMANEGEPMPAPQVKSLARQIASEIGAPHMEAKIGRVLSSANENRIVQAKDLLEEVLGQLADGDE